MIVEQHDGDSADPRGTLMGRAGTGDTIAFPYQAEMWVKEMLDTSTRRIYVHSHEIGYVWAVIARAEDGKFAYVARAKDWRGEWQLPFLTDARGISTAMLGQGNIYEVKTFDEGEKWAADQLKDSSMATAIVVDAYGILGAWEQSNRGPVLVAKGPRPLPTRNSA